MIMKLVDFPKEPVHSSYFVAKGFPRRSDPKSETALNLRCHIIVRRVTVCPAVEEKVATGRSKAPIHGGLPCITLLIGQLSKIIMGMKKCLCQQSP